MASGSSFGLESEFAAQAFSDIGLLQRLCSAADRIRCVISTRTCSELLDSASESGLLGSGSLLGIWRPDDSLT